MNSFERKFAKLLGISLGISNLPENFIISEDEENEILRIAKLQDLSHLIHLGAIKINNTNIADKTKQEYLNTIKRKAKQELTLKEVSDIFEKNSIDYIPLKGSVVCKIYPEEWMRKSGDIDILVREQDYEKSKDIFLKELRYKNAGIWSHHIELINEKGVSIELHRHVNGVMDVSRVDKKKYVSEIWNTSVPVKEEKHEYKMRDEWFYFYHIVHMIRHFEKGGCGLKFYVDLWFLNNPINSRIKRKEVIKREEILKKHGYKKFEQVSVEFSKILLEEKIDTRLDSLADFVFNAGVFGNAKQKAIYQSLKFDGKIKYVYRRVFMPYEQLKWSYPIIEKYPALTPVFEVVRWSRLVFKEKKLNNTEFHTMIESDEELTNKVKEIQELVGL